MSTVLVTGGAGYIGAHVLTVLAAAGHRCICIDNYANSSPTALARVGELTLERIEAHEADIRDRAALEAAIGGREIDSVIHMAGLKAVGESVQFPEKYYDHNVNGTRTLLQALERSPVRNFVFSSSAVVYGMEAQSPISEAAATAPINPYGENKLEIERMLAEHARDRPWRVANLRYFNPVGAHPSGRIGEDPTGTPNNLMPFVCQVAAGRLGRLRIFGNDYPTPDGTGVRDYIHVMDLAEGHVAALEALEHLPDGSVITLNLGTGTGFSVLELVEAFERVNGVEIPRELAPRRSGDLAVCYADPSLAARMLGWRTRRGIEEMCRDAWNWQRANPMGYREI